MQNGRERKKRLWWSTVVGGKLMAMVTGHNNGNPTLVTI
jgi:hypothetical protein